MDILEAQRRIVDWVEQRDASIDGYRSTPETSFVHLTEELGEVARQLTNRRVRQDRYDEANLKEEVVDVILESLILANLLDVELDSEIDNKIKVLFQRYGFSES